MNIAAKYALALIQVDDKLFNHIEAVGHMEAHLKKNVRIIDFLKMPALSRSIKESGLCSLAQKFGIKEQLEPIIRLLGNHRRLYLIHELLRELIVLYRKQRRIMLFSITSAPELAKEQCAQLQKFLLLKTGYTIEYTYAHDPSLIAGIRLQSNTKLWEHSIAQQLNRLKQQALIG